MSILYCILHCTHQSPSRTQTLTAWHCVRIVNDFTDTVSKISWHCPFKLIRSHSEARFFNSEELSRIRPSPLGIYPAAWAGEELIRLNSSAPWTVQNDISPLTHQNLAYWLFISKAGHWQELPRQHDNILISKCFAFCLVYEYKHILYVVATPFWHQRLNMF